MEIWFILKMQCKSKNDIMGIYSDELIAIKECNSYNKSNCKSSITMKKKDIVTIEDDGLIRTNFSNSNMYRCFKIDCAKNSKRLYFLLTYDLESYKLKQWFAVSTSKKFVINGAFKKFKNEHASDEDDCDGDCEERLIVDLKKNNKVNVYCGNSEDYAFVIWRKSLV